MKNICGEKFLSMIRFGSEISKIVKERDVDAIKRHTTEEMVSLSGKEVSNHLPPLPFAAAAICLILIIVFVINMAFILHSFNLEPPVFISFYFFIALIFLIVMFLASAMIAKGNFVGLQIYGAAYIFITLQFFSAISLQFIDREDQIVKKMAVFFFVAIAIVFCRWLMNAPAFTRFVIYRITMRLSVAAREMRAH
ncbi:hypothetical protein ACRS85_11550 [Pluralibacter gergoviae]|uniref:hypothetical protein n=1 Tax=Pluralibacter gergoviae TaxID=61647 RepID=UPI003EE1E667